MTAAVSPIESANYLRPHQKAELEQDIKACKGQLATRDPAEQVDRRPVAKRLKRLERDLESQTAPELNAQERVECERELKGLEETIRNGIPPRDTMMRNPSGAVGRNMAFEKAHKKDVVRWKNLQIQFNPDSDDPDIANAERLRAPTDNLANYQDAQIAKKSMSIPSEQFMANYDGVNWQTKFETLQKTVEALQRDLGVPVAEDDSNDTEAPGLGKAKAPAATG